MGAVQNMVNNVVVLVGVPPVAAPKPQLTLIGATTFFIIGRPCG